MYDTIDNRTLALAGMLQAIALINEITQTGKTNDEAFHACLHSLFQLESQDTASVFGSPKGVKLGLEKIIHHFNPIQTQDHIHRRYLLSLLSLQKKLIRSPKRVKELNDRIHQLRKQVSYFFLTHPTVVSNLADLYLTTLGSFKFRLTVLSNQRSLQVRENMEKIRALLLAGVRAAVLWRQLGGSRLHLLFCRTKIQASATRLLAQLEQNTLSQKDAL